MNPRDNREIEAEDPTETIEGDPPTKLRELVARYGHGITQLTFDKEKVYLLLGDKTKIDDRQLLWVGRTLDKHGCSVIIGMIEPDALRIVELTRAESSKTTGEKLIMSPGEWRGRGN